MLHSARIEFRRYKALGEKSLARIPDDRLAWQPDEEVNSATVLVKHLHGNMLSRWTEFLTTDGEKPWRKRAYEFEEEELPRERLTALWEEGWDCLFTALEALTPEDLSATVYIRGEAHSVTAAILRQLAHYASHVGQLITLAKITREGPWETLSIARNKSTK